MTPEFTLGYEYAVATWQILAAVGITVLVYFAGYLMGRLDRREGGQ